MVSRSIVPRSDLGRVLSLDCCIPGVLREPLMSQPERETVGEPRRVHQVVGRIRLWTAGEQREGADQASVDPNGNSQAGLQAAVRSGHDIEHLRLDTVENRHRPIARDSFRRAIGRSGVQTRRPVFAQEDELGLVIRDNSADDRGEMLKEVTDLEFA
jgi:hypothetical protein